jgi:hypothetical protein
MHNQIWICWVIRHEMHSIIMLSIHAGVHHEDAGFDGSAFAGPEDHRTDGQLGRSASLQNFDAWLPFEAQYTIAGVGDFDREGFVVAKLDVAIVDFLLVHNDPGSPATIPAASVGKQERGGDDQYSAEDRDRPGEAFPPSLPSMFSAHQVSVYNDRFGMIFKQ